MKPQVYRNSRESFGEEHVATRLAKAGPWSLLEGIPLNELEAPKHGVGIVKNFEKADTYIV
ncbi:MAG: hypothetical protein V1915_02965 [Candidatus Bathyarchaeota archaeon]